MPFQYVGAVFGILIKFAFLVGLLVLPFGVMATVLGLNLSGSVALFILFIIFLSLFILSHEVNLKILEERQGKLIAFGVGLISLVGLIAVSLLRSYNMVSLTDSTIGGVVLVLIGVPIFTVLSVRAITDV